MKSQTNRGERKEFYRFRDQSGPQVDFLVPRLNAQFWRVEAEASRTAYSTMADPILSLKKAAGDRVSRSLIVHRKARSQPEITAVSPGVEAITMKRFSYLINEKP